MGHSKPINHLEGLEELLQEETWIGNESKKDQFSTTTAISKRANAKLGIKLSRHPISRILNEINLSNRLASTNLAFIKKNKLNRLKFATEHVSGIVFISVMNQSLTCSVVTGEGSFDEVIRNNIRLSALKSRVKLGGESVLVFGMLSDTGTGRLVRLHGKCNGTVHKMILKKHDLPNLRTAINQSINQLYLCKITLCYTAKSVKIFLSEEDASVMKWPAQSPDMNPIENV